MIFNTFSYRTPLVAASMAIQNMTESYRKIQSTISKHIVKQFFRLKKQQQIIHFLQKMSSNFKIMSIFSWGPYYILKPKIPIVENLTYHFSLKMMVFISEIKTIIYTPIMSLQMRRNEVKP